MSYLIALDDGHGMSTAGKRTPKFLDNTFMHENEFNRAVKRYLKADLERHGFKTLLVAPTDEDTPLTVRTNLANTKKADIYISIHANAHLGRWGSANGIEVYHYKNSVKGKKLATAIHKRVIQGTKQTNRGIKTANFHVLRETKMPAVLVEFAFMDNLVEAKLLRSDSYRKECAIELAKGICDYYGVTYKAETPTIKTGKLYKVQVDAFSSKGNAERLKKELEAKGYKTIEKYEKKKKKDTQIASVLVFI